MIAGVIKEGETNHLSKLLYRTSRGKVVAFFENIGTGLNDEFKDLDTNYGRAMGQTQLSSYSAYVLVFTGSTYLTEKVRRIAQSFSQSNFYEMPRG